MPSSKEQTGPVLVVGGCGFVGHNVVKALLADPSCGPVHVASRRPTMNIFDGVSYRSFDVCDAAATEQLIQQVQPQIVMHVAAPQPMDASIKDAEYGDTNVLGARNLLQAIQKCKAVRVFVFTSTVNVIQGTEHVKAREDSFPYWTKDSNCQLEYWRTKAAAEKLILAANTTTPQGLKTVAVRLCLTIGEQDPALVTGHLDALAQGKTGVQLGDNKNLLDTVGAESAARAHLLAMHALLDGKEGVAGEAFNITDADPWPFWDVARAIWKAAGDTRKPGDVKVIPAWAAYGMAVAAEGMYKLFVRGGSRQPALNRHVVNFCVSNYTYDIGKAERVLGFVPRPRTEEELVKSTEWELKRRAQAKGEEKGEK